MSQEREGPYSDNKEWFKYLKDKSSFFIEFQKIVQNFDKTLQEGNFECQFEALSVVVARSRQFF